MSDSISSRLRLSIPPNLGGREPDPNTVAPDWELKRVADIETLQGMDRLVPGQQIASADDMVKLANVGFEFKEKLGQGSFGVIWECEFFNRNTGFKVNLACKRVSIFQIKEIKKTVGFMVERLKNEMTATRILMLNPHDNILKTQTIIRFYYPDGRIAYPYNHLVFMEIMDGDLEKFIETFCGGTTSFHDVNGLSDNDCKKLAVQLIAGVDFLHNSSKRPEFNKPEENITICHCDIKLDNVFFVIRNNQVTFKLADFGFALVFNSGQEVLTELRRGTRGYYGRELIDTKLRANSDVYDPRITCDVYALGATIFASWIGFNPDGKNFFIYEAFDMMEYNSWKKIRSQFDTMSDEMFNFVSNCCSHKPEQRYSLEKAKEDAWLNGVDQVGVFESVSKNETAVEGFYQKQKERQMTVDLRRRSHDDWQAKQRKRFASE